MELFVLKLLDGVLGTLKGIFMLKNKGLLSALAGTVGTFFYLTMVMQLIKVNTTSGILLICLATFLGTYIPMLIAKKIEKEKVYIFNITPDTNEKGKDFADQIRQANIPVLTYKGYNKSTELVLCCKIFSQSKEQSRLIANMIPTDFKYHVIETQNSIAA